MVVYTSAVYGPDHVPGSVPTFQATFFRDWLQFVGITDVSEVRARSAPGRAHDMTAALPSMPA